MIFHALKQSSILSKDSKKRKKLILSSEGTVFSNVDYLIIFRRVDYTNETDCLNPFLYKIPRMEKLKLSFPQ